MLSISPCSELSYLYRRRTMFTVNRSGWREPYLFRRVLLTRAVYKCSVSFQIRKIWTYFLIRSYFSTVCRKMIFHFIAKNIPLSVQGRLTIYQLQTQYRSSSVRCSFQSKHKAGLPSKTEGGELGERKEMGKEPSILLNPLQLSHTVLALLSNLLFQPMIRYCVIICPSMPRVALFTNYRSTLKTEFCRAKLLVF